jgi:hypothetical protein
MMQLMSIIIGFPIILLGVIAHIVISTGRAFKKLNRLDIPARNNLVLIEYYMAAVRNFSNEELLKLSKLSEDERNIINVLDDYEKKLQTMREIIG